MDKFEFTPWFEVNKTFGAKEINISIVSELRLGLIQTKQSL